VQEADLIVSFFTRDFGKLKGVAKAALKSRKRFGGALEPTTVARAWFAERPRQELVRLDQLEMIRSPLSAPVDSIRMAALSFYAEVLDEALPEHDPQDAVFRLVLAVLERTTVEQPWMPLTYFSLWMTRLMGLLPNIAHCIACGEPLYAQDAKHESGHDFSRAEASPPKSGATAPERNPSLGETMPERSTGIYFSPSSDGLFCALHRTGSATSLSADSWQLAQRMLRSPASAFAAELWPRRRGQDLRRFTLQALERHLERKLRTAEALGRL
jgi:DNA repair protein RecO (recombination protein O)